VTLSSNKIPSFIVFSFFFVDFSGSDRSLRLYLLQWPCRKNGGAASPAVPNRINQLADSPDRRPHGAQCVAASHLPGAGDNSF
jgi:hypothetical protein